MFTGGAVKTKSYVMEYVPLRIGVKIRPDDEFYTGKAIQTYKDARLKLTQYSLSEELKQETDEH